jgi:hypothetical protein
LLVVGLVGPAAGWSHAGAADIETRDFTVSIGGKYGGEAHITIQRQDDGVTKVRCDTDINFKPFPLVKYRYTYRGQEVWKDGRVLRLDSSCHDDGKNYVVAAFADANGVRVRVNSQPERMARPEVWLTSYWSLPDKSLRDQVLALLDVDTGQDLQGRLHDVGAEQRTVAGQLQDVHHYRVAGKLLVDLWYDAAERLVRQEWTEDGRRVVVDLVRVRR